MVRLTIPSLKSHTKSPYVQPVPDKTCLFLDRPQTEDIGFLNARRTHKYFWAHESLDIGTFCLGLSRHIHVLSGTVWTHWLFVWDLKLGIVGLTVFFCNPKYCHCTEVPLWYVLQFLDRNPFPWSVHNFADYMRRS